MSDQKIITPTELLAHGEYVNPTYADGAAGDNSPEAQPEASLHGTLRRFDKNRRADSQVQAFGWIKATYAEAIEYAGQKQGLEGGIMVGAFFGVPFALVAFGMMFGMIVLFGGELLFISLLLCMACLAMLALGYWALLFPLRHVWRTPRDLPILFDRAHRKVYRLAQQREPGLKGLVKPWPVKALCYEWNLLDAEHHAELIGSANSARRLHRLVFVVRKSADDPTIIDTFEIGNGLAQGEEMVAPMFEHIRRFMEEQGPHLPHPSEPLDERSEDLPTWWQACGRAGPWGDSYLKWWREDAFMPWLHHVLVLVGVIPAAIGIYKSQSLAPLIMLGLSWISLAMVWGQGTGIWLMAHTSYRLAWPHAVNEATGPATRKGTGW